MVATSSFTPRCSTVWLRTVMPRSNSLFSAALVMPVISRGWLKWVCSTTSLCSLRPCSTTRVRASVQASSVRIFCGITAGPLVAKRNAAHVGHRQQRLADLGDLLGAQLVGVAAGDDDVLQLGARGDVGEGLLPALGVDLEVELLHLLGVDADRVAARAEAAVDRAGVQRQEQRLVGVAVGQARAPACRRARAASRGPAWGDRAAGATPAG